jgi:BolA protein
VLVSQSFEGQSAVKRHQSVYAVLAAELQSGVHALALHTYLPEEWKSSILCPVRLTV